MSAIKVPKFLRKLNPFHKNKEPKIEDEATLQWVHLDRDGAFNHVYKSSIPLKLLQDSDFDGYWVKKIPKEHSSQLNSPKRSKRISKEINPELPAETFIDSEGKAYWVTQFIDGKEPTDQEARACLLSIYVRSRRIIFDGCGQGNLIKARDKVYCVDMDLALKVSTPNSPRSAEQSKNLENFFNDNWWTNHQQNFPKTCDLIQTLEFLERNFPSGDIKKEHINEPVLQTLSKIRKLDLEELEIEFDGKLLDFIFLYQKQKGIPRSKILVELLSNPSEINKFLNAAKKGLSLQTDEETLPYLKEITSLMIEYLATNKLSKNPFMVKGSRDSKQHQMMALIPGTEQAKSIKDLQSVLSELVVLSKQHRDPFRTNLSSFFEGWQTSTSTNSCQSLIKLLDADVQEHKDFTNFLKKKNKLELLQMCDISTYSCALLDSELPLDGDELTARCNQQSISMA